MLCLRDNRLAERFYARFGSGITPVLKFIEGGLKYFFPEGAQPAVRYKGRVIGKILFVDEAVATVGIEGVCPKFFNYFFDSKHKKYISF